MGKQEGDLKNSRNTAQRRVAKKRQTQPVTRARVTDSWGCVQEGIQWAHRKIGSLWGENGSHLRQNHAPNREGEGPGQVIRDVCCIRVGGIQGEKEPRIQRAKTVIPVSAVTGRVQIHRQS